MKKTFYNLPGLVIILFTAFILTACDSSSSPEGRMTMKLEDLQKQMMDSLKYQNKAILDSLSAIRSELNEIKQENR